jgi:elongation factor Ts
MATVKEIPAKLVAELRARTGAGMMDCKKALEETGGDLEKAVDVLRTKGAAKADKRAGREASEGVIGHYVHHDGKIGVLVELNSETDFVARTDDFKTLAREVAMQVAATNPTRISSKEESTDGDVPLLDQPYIRDASKTVQDLVNETIAKVRENIVIRRFARFEIGGN